MTTTDLQKLLAEATKGPWVAENARKITLDPNPAWIAPINTVEDDDGGFYTVAFGPSWHGTDDEPEAQANARLIAMAPDLAARVLELEAENKRLRAWIENLANNPRKPATWMQTREAAADFLTSFNKEQNCDK
jgi:hypothetical protein